MIDGQAMQPGEQAVSPTGDVATGADRVARTCRQCLIERVQHRSVNRPVFAPSVNKVRVVIRVKPHLIQSGHIYNRMGLVVINEILVAVATRGYLYILAVRRQCLSNDIRYLVSTRGHINGLEIGREPAAVKALAITSNNGPPR
ncbi:unannotated protein [freshwater metagenome]|uniref:Unannotated protein n=1 Tax=freshwater metagenome TaxID=449393 RepID=A0A6J7PY33_9ZZZZ